MDEKSWAADHLGTERHRVHRPRASVCLPGTRRSPRTTPCAPTTLRAAWGTHRPARPSRGSAVAVRRGAAVRRGGLPLELWTPVWHSAGRCPTSYRGGRRRTTAATTGRG